MYPTRDYVFGLAQIENHISLGAFTVVSLLLLLPSISLQMP